MNQKNRAFFVVLCLSVFIMQGCSKTENNTPKWVEVTPDILREMIANNKALFILDVRNPDELVSGPAPLKNAVNIPLPELSNRYTELPLNKAIVVVCRSGHRSATAADLLIQAGFTKVYSLEGGMTAFRASEK